MVFNPRIFTSLSTGVPVSNLPHRAGSSFGLGLGLRRHSTLLSFNSQALRTPCHPCISSHKRSFLSVGSALALPANFKSPLSPLSLRSGTGRKVAIGTRTMATTSFPSTIKAIGCQQQGDIDVIDFLKKMWGDG